jgi:hypothetical protein
MQSTTPKRDPLELVLEELGIELERIRRSVKAKLFGKPAAPETNASSRVRYSVQRITKGEPKNGKGQDK